MDTLADLAILFIAVGVICAVYSAFALGRRTGVYDATARQYERGYAAGYESGYLAGYTEAEEAKALDLLFLRLQRSMATLKELGFTDHATRVRLALQREKWKGAPHGRAYQRDAPR